MREFDNHNHSGYEQHVATISCRYANRTFTINVDAVPSGPLASVYNPDDIATNKQFGFGQHTGLPLQIFLFQLFVANEEKCHRFTDDVLEQFILAEYSHNPEIRSKVRRKLMKVSRVPQWRNMYNSKLLHSMLTPTLLSIRYDSTKLPIFLKRRMDHDKIIELCKKYKIPDARFLSPELIAEFQPSEDRFQEATFDEWEWKE